jgi:hypothetical protein
MQSKESGQCRGLSRVVPRARQPRLAFASGRYRVHTVSGDLLPLVRRRFERPIGPTVGDRYSRYCSVRRVFSMAYVAQVTASPVRANFSFPITFKRRFARLRRGFLGVSSTTWRPRSTNPKQRRRADLSAPRRALLKRREAPFSGRRFDDQF